MAEGDERFGSDPDLKDWEFIKYEDEDGNPLDIPPNKEKDDDPRKQSSTDS